MSSDERRNKIIVGVVIIIVTVAIVALILLKTSTSAALTCQLTDSEPSYAEAAPLKPVASADNKTLVAFQGYLIYGGLAKDEKKINLPLELASIELLEVANTEQQQQQQQRLMLNLDCAKINITLRTEQAKDGKASVSSASEISVHLETAGSDKLDSCQVEKLDSIAYESDKHFECSDFELVCTTKKHKEETPADGDDKGDAKDGDDQSITLVTLKMRKLEFELNGNVDKHKEGQFSTEVMHCAKQ